MWCAPESARRPSGADCSWHDGEVGRWSTVAKQTLLARAVCLCVIAVGLAATAQPSYVAACSCATASDEEAAANADAVFSGTLAEVLTPAGDTYSSDDPERCVFRGG